MAQPVLVLEKEFFLISNFFSFFKKIFFKYGPLLGRIVHWIGAQVCVFRSLESREKSLNMLKFCRNDQRKRAPKSSTVLVLETVQSLVQSVFEKSGLTYFFSGA